MFNTRKDLGNEGTYDSLQPHAEWCENAPQRFGLFLRSPNDQRFAASFTRFFAPAGHRTSTAQNDGLKGDGVKGITGALLLSPNSVILTSLNVQFVGSMFNAPERYSYREYEEGSSGTKAHTNRFNRTQSGAATFRISVP